MTLAVIASRARHLATDAASPLPKNAVHNSTISSSLNFLSQKVYPRRQAGAGRGGCGRTCTGRPSCPCRCGSPAFARRCAEGGRPGRSRRRTALSASRRRPLVTSSCLPDATRLSHVTRITMLVLAYPCDKGRPIRGLNVPANRHFFGAEVCTGVCIVRATSGARCPGGQD